MFTGIVERIGRVERIEDRPGSRRLTVAVRPGPGLPPWRPVLTGESIAVDGVCLTVVESREGAEPSATFEAVPETLERTTLGERRTGDPVNLERALRVGDPLGGHHVTGHVDGVGRVRSRLGQGDQVLFEIEAAPDLLRQVLRKGSIAVDGISLTVVDVHRAGGAFSFAAIPHTLTWTTLGAREPGARVNLETDAFGKWILQGLAELAGEPGDASLRSLLERAGFLPGELIGEPGGRTAMRTFDFHLHTRSSDGQRTAREACELAAAAGLSGISITDHDTLDAYGELEAAAPPAGLAVLRGIEVSASLGEEEVHVLGYFPGGLSAAAHVYAESLVALRRERIARGILRLRERGLDVTLAECEARASGRIVSRKHVAELLAERRYVGRPQAAYARHLGPDVFPLPAPAATATVSALRELGAVVLWAHPSLRQVQAWSPTLEQAGLDGVEVFIPRRSKAERAELLATAEARGLIVSGGSDWHGSPKGLELGRFRIAAGQVERFLERIGWEAGVT